MTRHLSSEELEGMMAGRGAESAERHVRECEMCAAELVHVRRLLGGARESAAQVADRQWLLAAKQRTQRVGIGAQATGTGWLRGGVWAGVMAVVLVAASLMFVWGPMQMRHPDPGHTVATGSGPHAGSQTPELSDEALLNGVQNDLSSTVPAPLEPLAATTTTTTNTNASNTKE